MAERQLNNPTGGNSMSSVVTDFRTGVGTDGHALAQHRDVIEMQSSGAIAVGDLVTLVPPSAADTPIRVKQTVTGDQKHLILGVALEAAAATGKTIKVITYGYCFINVGATTPAAGNWGSPSANAGEVAVNTAAADASTVIATSLGSFLSAKNASNRAQFWFSKC